MVRSYKWRGEPRVYTKKETYERLLEHVSMEPMSGCWIWLGALNSKGYGHTRDNQERQRGAHKVMYEAVKGPIPEGLQLDHTCRLHCCVNPDHLEVVTQRENLIRGHRWRETNGVKINRQSH